MKNLTQPHDQVDARIPESRDVVMEGAIAGHVLVKNENALPFAHKPVMLSVFGYDATVPATKNADVLFQLGYTSSPEMGQAELGTEKHFDQAARGGTIVTGGRAGANGPPYIADVSYYMCSSLPNESTYKRTAIELYSTSRSCRRYLGELGPYLLRSRCERRFGCLPRLHKRHCY